MPPFVVTLGGLTVFRGLTLTISNGGPISGFDASMRWFGTGLIGPVPVPAIIFVIAAVLCHIVLSYTRYGRAVYAVGGNAEAARLSNTPNEVEDNHRETSWPASFSLRKVCCSGKPRPLLLRNCTCMSVSITPGPARRSSRR